MMSRIWTILTLALCATYVAILAANAPDVGFTRDEGYYFKAAEQYGAWWDTLFSSRFFDAFSDGEIKTRFGYNTEHPALIKLSQGVTYRVLHQWLGWARPSTGFRAAGFLFAALSLFATFLLGRALVSARVGFVAAVMLATIPRWFFDAHLACFDVPMTAMWALALWAFWRAWSAPPGHQRGASILAGVVFGLGLATKLNALFLPFVFVAVWLWCGRVYARSRVTEGPSGGFDVELPPIPWVLLACAIIGPLVFIAHWPYLWHDTFTRIGAYIGFHANHEHYPASYFFDVLTKPPFPIAFPFTMTALTVPSPLLVLGSLGMLLAAYRMLVKRDAAETLLVLGTLIPMIAIALPSSPIFGGVKHWYNAMPVLAVLAARAAMHGVDVVVERRPQLRGAVTAVFVVLVALPGALGIAASPATGIGYYNEIAGGYRGGAELGMQRGFWGGLARPTFDRLQDLNSGSRIFFNRANYDAYRMYIRDGIVPAHVYYANQAERTDGGVHFEQPEHGEQEGAIWSSVGTRPVDGVYVDNVTLVQLYLKGPSAAAP